MYELEICAMLCLERSILSMSHRWTDKPPKWLCWRHTLLNRSLRSYIRDILHLGKENSTLCTRPMTIGGIILRYMKEKIVTIMLLRWRMRIWTLLCLNLVHRSCHRRFQGWQWRKSRTEFIIDFWKTTRSFWILIFVGNSLGLFKSMHCLRNNKLLLFSKKYIQCLI